MKWQYIILAAVFIGALALSLWMASHVDTNDIERGLTHSSSDEHDSFVEGGNVPLYLGITATLFVIALGSFFFLSKRR
ncbi:MAG: hypothetical protein WAL97_10175 [Halobacteriota archaeon]